ncbi:MAG: redox-sensing transcriptional repressor Rex [Deltaproteobacteria bacterium CG_4_10_14_3_um_filter_51_14]|nr:MAG: redox-sensing transcriptional repressor Rex [Deltaproteobacteria bacterium CG_4_10_14_3_um_filter_51_14]
MTGTKRVPGATITRLSIYHRQLELLEFDGYRLVSSDKLAWLCQVSSAQVRKDLGYFGGFGVRGVGYDVLELQAHIREILSINKVWNLAVVGIGNLGSALLRSRGFALKGFNCVAAFDKDPAKIGKFTAAGIRIKNITELARSVKEMHVDMGVITTPPSEAQRIADMFIRGKVNALLNFSPIRIYVPDCCLVENIDFTIKLDILTYRLTHGDMN